MHGAPLLKHDLPSNAIALQQQSVLPPFRFWQDVPPQVPQLAAQQHWDSARRIPNEQLGSGDARAMRNVAARTASRRSSPTEPTLNIARRRDQNHRHSSDDQKTTSTEPKLPSQQRQCPKLIQRMKCNLLSMLTCRHHPVLSLQASNTTSSRLLRPIQQRMQPE